LEQKITFENGELKIPKNPVIAYIEGDGIGVDITPPVLKVIDAAVKKSYSGERKIIWKEILAGEKAFKETGSYLPDETPAAIKEYKIAIKGPLTTPIGGGFRSLNVSLRQILDLYSCIRPVNYIKGVPSPMVNPQNLDIVIFRENTEDVYAGIEFEAGSAEAS